MSIHCYYYRIIIVESLNFPHGHDQFINYNYLQMMYIVYYIPVRNEIIPPSKFVINSNHILCCLSLSIRHCCFKDWRVARCSYSLIILDDGRSITILASKAKNKKFYFYDAILFLWYSDRKRVEETALLYIRMYM